MATALCDGIETRYELSGDGPPLLLFSPGGFNARLENWWTFGIYQRLGLVERLRRHFTCIAFDKRESGESGGRLERLTWEAYAGQAVALLDALGIERAFCMGGCIGCSIVVNCPPERMRGLVLYSPAGGAAYLDTQQGRFARHLEFAGEHGLGAVVELARSGEATFANDPRVGPWVSVLRRDDAFARAYAAHDPDDYRALVRESARSLFDRESVPGAPSERLAALELPALVVPGDDANHATSAALHLAEHLPGAEYWDALPPAQTAETAPARVLEFLLQQ